MFRNAKTRDWVIVSAVCFVALALLLSVTGFSSAFSKTARPQPAAAVTEVSAMAPDCPMPTPAPACTAGQTLCSEGTGQQCQATIYTCGGTPPVWGPGVQCTQNACTHGPGTVGSTCQ